MKRKLLLFGLIVLISLVFMLSGVLGATRLYYAVYGTDNKSYINDVCVDAPPLDDGPRPTCGNEIEASEAEYNQINVSDGTWWKEADSIGAYVYRRFNFTIGESVEDITKLNITVENNATGASTNITGWIWNWTASDWKYMFSAVGIIKQKNETLYTAAIEDLINSTNGWLIFVVQGSGSGDYMWMDYAGVQITTGVAAAPAEQVLNDTYTPVNAGLKLDYSVTDTGGIEDVRLQTNETGTWKSYTTRNTTTADCQGTTTCTVNFSWNVGVLCDRVVAIRVKYQRNDTLWNYSDTNTTYIMPYVVQFTGTGLTKGTLTCTNASKASLTTSGTGTGNFTIWMPHISYNASIPCYFGVTNVNRTYGKNETNYCILTANLTSSIEAPTFVISLKEAIKPILVTNIPAAIALSTIAAIILIYTYVRKKKSEGW